MSESSTIYEKKSTQVNKRGSYPASTRKAMELLCLSALEANQSSMLKIMSTLNTDLTKNGHLDIERMGEAAVCARGMGPRGCETMEKS